MSFYTIQNGSLLIAENKQTLTRFYNDVKPLPDDYAEGKYYVKDNELVRNEHWEEEQLAKVKQEKIHENDIVRDEALNQGVFYKDVLFDSDTDQKVNLLAIVSTMSETDTIIWFGMDNQPMECDKEDLINIGSLITQLHSFCWNKNAEIKQMIDNSTSVDEVKNVVINYKMEV